VTRAAEAGMRLTKGRAVAPGDRDVVPIASPGTFSSEAWASAAPMVSAISSACHWCSGTKARHPAHRMALRGGAAMRAAGRALVMLREPGRAALHDQAGLLRSPSNARGPERRRRWTLAQRPPCYPQQAVITTP